MLRFPRMHVAQSVVNRIINTAQGVQQNMLPPPSIPSMPDVAGQGAALDQAMQTPPQGAALPPGGEGAIVQSTLEGADMVPAIVDTLTPE